jgi:hypothetical protein
MRVYFLTNLLLIIILLFIPLIRITYMPLLIFSTLILLVLQLFFSVGLFYKIF